MMLFCEIGATESHRRRGAGKAMIALLKSIRRDRGVVKIYVFTNLSNDAAMALYGSAGCVADTSGDEISFTWVAGDFGP